MTLSQLLKELTDLLGGERPAEIEAKLLQLREAALAMQEETLTLKEQLAESRQQLDEQQPLVYRGGLYWRQDGTGEQEGPYCQLCWEKDRKQIHLQEREMKWHCLFCGSAYDK